MDWLRQSDTAPTSAPIATLEEAERAHILAALESTGWRVSGRRGAAELLGLKPTTLESRMKKLGVERVR
ncbi:MAG TPA: helix-turn-helix domain-containing protein [Candidatus Acidoferrum sp.]|nr:helix-turn-helix domain-containing protein [Candidatus Acidoferrum sp.]